MFGSSLKSSFFLLVVLVIVALISAVPAEKRSQVDSDDSSFNDDLSNYMFSRHNRANIDGGFLSRYNAARSFANMKAAERLARIYGRR